jgi:hypothetical protein
MTANKQQLLQHRTWQVLSIQFTHDPYIKEQCQNPKCTTEILIDGAGGRSTNLLSAVVLLAWWRSWGRSHLLVGGVPPRWPSVLRRPLVLGAAPPCRPSVPRWPLMPHHPPAIGPAPSRLPSVLHHTPVEDGRPTSP